MMSPPKELLLLWLATAGLAVGGVLYLLGQHDAANVVWAATTVVGVVPAAWWVLDATRHRRLGVDVIALLALDRHAGLVRSIFAGAVITVMLASGRTLEARAAARARRELRVAARTGTADRAPLRRRRVDALHRSTQCGREIS